MNHTPLPNPKFQALLGTLAPKRNPWKRVQYMKFQALLGTLAPLWIIRGRILIEEFQALLGTLAPEVEGEDQRA